MNPNFNKNNGLLPVIVQDVNTLQVLMLGYMNAEALGRTQETGKVTFYSRSKQRLWTKGESSGNFLTVKFIREDCDRDALLIQAEPAGPTCHTGSISCFDARSEAMSDDPGSVSYSSEAASNVASTDPIQKSETPSGNGEGRKGVDFNQALRLPAAENAMDPPRQSPDPDRFLYQLEGIIHDRINAEAEASYTFRLFQKGINKVAQKVGEEAVELVIEAKDNNAELFKNEAADLLYHYLILLKAKEFSLADIEAVLQKRNAG